MPPRIWNLRINLDEFNAALGSVFTDEDRALLLQGMGLGFNGGLCSNTVPAPFRTGYTIGAESRNEADGYQQKKSIAGLASAETRKERYGTAQPSKLPLTVFEQCSNDVLTVSERCPNQSPIPNPLTNNPQTPNPKSKRRSRVDDLTAEVPIEMIDAVNSIMALTPIEDQGGRKIRATRPEVLIRVQGIVTSHSAITPGDLVEAWKDYLNSSPRSIKAPQYFFGKAENQGPNGANWEAWIKGVFVRRQLAEKGGES
ncbi:MAG: hypothetical protein C0436_04085 [Alphaproteobacteria bacterium]|nr:hypothetical protein [Alphaproteobacteria bacterium]